MASKVVSILFIAASTAGSLGFPVLPFKERKRALITAALASDTLRFFIGICVVLLGFGCESLALSLFNYRPSKVARIEEFQLLLDSGTT
jgi:hypothetical protein